MTGLVVLSIVLVGIPQGSVEQRTGGWCSPPIANIQGNVTVNCVGVDPRALDRLNARLSQTKQDLSQKIREANEWAEKYFELEKRLSEATDDSRLSEEAEKYLHAGQLDEAEEILKALLQRDEQQIDRVAANHYNLALILGLQFQPVLALAHLEKAYRYRPENTEYAHQYARALQGLNRLDESENVYRLNLVRIRELSKRNQDIYLPFAAKTLSNLGYVYEGLGRNKEAQGSYQDALEIYRQLAISDPSHYLLLKAEALDGLGLVYDKMGDFERAERNYSECLAVYRRLATEFGGVYNVDAALLLDHLGEHYRNRQDQVGAETMYKEVVSTARHMAQGNEPGSGFVLALALGHLGDLYRQLHRFDEAENSYKEALDIYRQMPSTVPAYLLLRAAAVNN
jgi:tetratricopeptide (TPR) repeat protein